MNNMSKKSVPAVVELSESSPQARRFSDEFKRESVRLVTEEKYTFQAAATASVRRACVIGMPSSLRSRCRVMNTPR